MEGRKITPPKAPEPTKPSDLMEALRQSAGGDSEARAEKRKAAPRKTAGGQHRRLLGRRSELCHSRRRFDRAVRRSPCLPHTAAVDPKVALRGSQGSHETHCWREVPSK
jgi:hypothetical protein